MDLLKPSGRVERAIDTLHHYHKGTSNPGRSTGPASGGIGPALSRHYYFPCPWEFWDEIQRLTHVWNFNRDGKSVGSGSWISSSECFMAKRLDVNRITRAPVSVINPGRGRSENERYRRVSTNSLWHHKTIMGFDCSNVNYRTARAYLNHPDWLVTTVLFVPSYMAGKQFWLPPPPK